MLLRRSTCSSHPAETPKRGGLSHNTVHLRTFLCYSVFGAADLQKEVIACTLPPWNQPRSRRLPTTKAVDYCSWNFVAGRFINTSALPQQCMKPCWARLPRAATSTGSFVDASPILWLLMVREACGGGVWLRVPIGGFRGTDGSRVTRWQPHHRLHQFGRPHQDFSVGQGDRCGCRRREDQPAATGFARARGRVLRHRVDAVHACLVSRSAAQQLGRCQVVTGTGVGSEGGRQVRNFAGAQQTGMGTAEATP